MKGPKEPKEPSPGDPLQQALRAVVLAAVFFMAVEALVFQCAVVSTLPANADLSWGAAINQLTGPQGSPAATRTYGK